MATLKAQSAGGKATAIIEKRQAKERYYSNPNHCVYCGKVIELREGTRVQDIRKKKYCNHSCAANHNNKLKGFIPKKERVSKTTECVHRPEAEILNRTKGELFSSRANWQSARSSIRTNANRIYSEHYSKKKCVVCGYDKHVEVCHKKSVSDFPDTALIREINDINNLVGLCPNHHWEFDEKLLIL